MDPSQPKNISPYIAWSLVALFAGIAAFSNWYYYDQVSTAYDSIPTFYGTDIHKKAATTTSTTTTPAATSATADWKTYTNSTYGFSFKYPKDWTVSESTLTDSLLNVSITNATIKEGTDNPGLARVTIYQTINKLDNQKLNPITIKEYLDKYAAISDPIYQSITTSKIGSISGYTAKMGTNQFGGGSFYIAELSDGKIVTIRTYNTGITADQVTNIFSTFQFLK